MSVQSRVSQNGRTDLYSRHAEVWSSGTAESINRMSGSINKMI